MVRLVIFTFVSFIACAPALGADDPRERLGWIVGSWTIEGREDSFREVCGWFHGRSHVVCNSESRNAAGTLRKGVTVISWSEEKKRFVYYYYGSTGVTVAMDIFVEGRSLIATAERDEGDDLVREQVWITPAEDGAMHFREDVSKNGGPWETRTQFRYVRAKE